MMTTASLPSLPSATWQDVLSQEPATVLFKHSRACGFSSAALEEIREFVAANAAIPVYLVDVLRERALSREIARTLGIHHASPQAILLRWGAPVWVAHHSGVTAAALDHAIRSDVPA